MSYISGETNNSEYVNIDVENVNAPSVRNIKDASFIREGDFTGSGHVLFYQDKDGKQLIVQATPDNVSWFHEIVDESMSSNLLATA